MNKTQAIFDLRHRLIVAAAETALSDNIPRDKFASAAEAIVDLADAIVLAAIAGAPRIESALAAPNGEAPEEPSIAERLIPASVWERMATPTPKAASEAKMPAFPTDLRGMRDVLNRAMNTWEPALQPPWPLELSTEVDRAIEAGERAKAPGGRSA